MLKEEKQQLCLYSLALLSLGLHQTTHVPAFSAGPAPSTVMTAVLDNELTQCNLFYVPDTCWVWHGNCWNMFLF